MLCFWMLIALVFVFWCSQLPLNKKRGCVVVCFVRDIFTGELIYCDRTEFVRYELVLFVRVLVFCIFVFGFLGRRIELVVC